MPIQNTDIVLYQSQDNTDNDNGGGARTGVVLADGLVNNLFPDISRVDTVGGDVALRKLFMVVDTNTRELYYGAHAIIRKTPTDPKVSSLLFHTDDPTDTRISAQADIEAYLVPSFKASFYLFGTNVEGAQALTFLQRLEEALPAVGDVILLREGVNEQYVRISGVDSAEVPYFFGSSDYIRRRLIVTIEQPLDVEFNGSSFNPAGQTTNSCDTFTTQQAAGAKFYGTKNLSVDASIGDSTITLDSIYEQLVPSTKQQTPLVNLDALLNGEFLVFDTASLQPKSEKQNVRMGGAGPTFQVDVDLGEPIIPGSFEYSNYIDDGEGNITAATGDVLYSINYNTGLIEYVSGNSGGGNTTARYRPAQLLTRLVQYSKGILIDLSNQGTVFVQNVAPVPDAANCYIDYRSNGKWYRLFGNMNGTLDGQGLGAGSINDNGDGTATISVTLAAVPDLDSTVIFSWGSQEALTKITQETIDTYDAYLEWDLGNTNIDINSITGFEYTPEGDSPVAVNGWATVSPNNTIRFSTGRADADMTVDPKAGKVYYRTVVRGQNGYPSAANPPTKSSDYITLSYNYAAEPTTGQAGEVKFLTDVALTNNAGVYEFSIGEAIEIANVKVKFQDSKYKHSISPTRGMQSLLLPSSTITLVSDAGGILRDSGGVARGTILADGTGTIDYGSMIRNNRKQVVIDGKVEYKYESSAVPSINIWGSELSNIEYTTSAIAGASYSNSVIDQQILNANARLKFKIPPNILGNFNVGIFGNLWLYIQGSDVILGGSTIGTYDSSIGLIDVPYSEIGTLIKGFDYIDFSPSALVTEDTSLPIDLRRAIFRTASQELVTSSLIVRYENSSGVQTATTNSSGDFITGVGVDLAVSYVDTETGMAYVEFTDPPVPGTIKYDAVAQSTLPLDPALLGLNPVRLPPDGRVPLFEPARFVVVFQEDETAIATPVADAVASSGKTDVALLEVVDVNGQRLAYDQYTQDKVAGTVTFANPLNLVDRNGDALTGPYRIIDRIEDMTMCVDAELNGTISLSAALTHNYLSGSAKVASALVWGDVGARVFNLFSQSLFDVWSDSMTQNVTPAQYDNVNFPIQVDNQSSFSGRWAIIFQSSTTVDVVSEKLGVLLENVSITSDIAPINPATTFPYFTIPSGGWGGGWVTSNVLRFNTESGDENFWVIRTVQSGTLTEETDDIDVEIRGDAN